MALLEALKEPFAGYSSGLRAGNRDSNLRSERRKSRAGIGPELGQPHQRMSMVLVRISH